ncbi:MAG TPA: DNA-deoxyinosine glycosylase [Steroidobacteraceae bacterium]
MSAVPAARLYSFPPVARADARLLILGSMPGGASLAAGQYYAHPQNQFWPIMEQLCGARRSLSYPARLRRLQQRRVALWDVLQSCVRSGSLDAAIDHGSAVPNDLPQLLREHPRIERLCCNGTTAYRTVQRFFGAQLQREFPQLQCLRLPSTSPAHAGMRLADKLLAWEAALKGA